MFTLLISIILVLAVLLILVILGQNSKGGAGAAFGGSASQIMGVTRTGKCFGKGDMDFSGIYFSASLGIFCFLYKQPTKPIFISKY